VNSCPDATDPRVDVYIDALPKWQQAICREVHDLVHAADPGITETIKRISRPYFVLQGDTLFSSLDGFALADGNGAGGRVVAACGDNPLGIGDYGRSRTSRRIQGLSLRQYRRT
jgi:hypothetical protein